MKTKKILISVLIILISISFLPLGDSYMVAAASKIGKLVIKNNFGERIYISFDGPRKYSFWVEPGKIVKEMERGEYFYTFYADGDNEVGFIKIKESSTLVLRLTRGKLTINNKISGNIYLSLYGPRDYDFSVPPGKTIKNLAPGIYGYSYYAEGGKQEGFFTLKKSGSVFVMKIDKGRLRIQNNHHQNILITFSGVVPYHLWTTPGRNFLEMRTGFYTYKYWFDGKSHEGGINIPPKGNTLILETPKVCNCNKKQYGCGDFVNQSQAQDCFLYCLGQAKRDVHRLDFDRDGLACEALP